MSEQNDGNLTPGEVAVRKEQWEMRSGGVSDHDEKRDHLIGALQEMASKYPPLQGDIRGTILRSAVDWIIETDLSVSGLKQAGREHAECVGELEYAQENSQLISQLSSAKEVYAANVEAIRILDLQRRACVAGSCESSLKQFGEFQQAKEQHERLLLDLDAILDKVAGASQCACDPQCGSVLCRTATLAVSNANAQIELSSAKAEVERLKRYAATPEREAAHKELDACLDEAERAEYGWVHDHNLEHEVDRVYRHVHHLAVRSAALAAAPSPEGKRV